MNILSLYIHRIALMKGPQSLSCSCGLAIDEPPSAASCTPADDHRAPVVHSRRIQGRCDVACIRYSARAHRDRSA